MALFISVRFYHPDESKGEESLTLKKKLENSYGVFMKKMLRKLTHINVVANEFLFPQEESKKEAKEVTEDTKEMKPINKQVRYKEKLEELHMSITQNARLLPDSASFKGNSLIKRLEEISAFDPQTEKKSSIKSIVVKELTSIQQYTDFQLNMLGVTYNKKNENFLRELAEIDKKLELLLLAN